MMTSISNIINGFTNNNNRIFTNDMQQNIANIINGFTNNNNRIFTNDMQQNIVDILNNSGIDNDIDVGTITGHRPVISGNNATHEPYVPVSWGGGRLLDLNYTQTRYINHFISVAINNIINNNYYVDDNILLLIYNTIERCVSNDRDINGFTLSDLRIIINSLNDNQINDYQHELCVIYALLKHSYYQQHNIGERSFDEYINLTNNNYNMQLPQLPDANVRNNLIQNTRDAIIYNDIFAGTRISDTNINSSYTRDTMIYNDVNSSYTRNVIIYNNEYTGVLTGNEYEITCPFCRKKNDRDGWIKTDIIDVCEICYNDNNALYKSNKCEHKICKKCVDGIKR
jgi:hypothetical protein